MNFCNLVVKSDIEAILAKHKALDGKFDYDWEYISGCLASIEQFAVGVNTGVYSVEILDRMAGSHIIKLFCKFKPIVDYKREKGKTNKRYIEFEMMVASLEKFNHDLKNIYQK